MNVETNSELVDFPLEAPQQTATHNAEQAVAQSPEGQKSSPEDREAAAEAVPF